MANSYFQFKQFTIQQDKAAMKVTTDACLFGAWIAMDAASAGMSPRIALDIGTGTGLLALMLLQKKNNTQLVAVELEKQSFEQAVENTNNSPWKEHATIFHTDVREFDYPQTFDLIISNPPFYENELKSDNAKKNIAHHDEGLLLPELLAVIKKHLKPDGLFYLLLPYKRLNDIKELLHQHEMSIAELLLVKQTTQHDFFRIMLKAIHRTDPIMETITKEISVKGENNEYTTEFVELLKDYYLYL